jgi:hypothetical protein
MYVKFWAFSPVPLLTPYRPHSRKEAKLDTKTKLYQLNELAGTNQPSSAFMRGSASNSLRDSVPLRFFALVT